MKWVFLMKFPKGFFRPRVARVIELEKTTERALLYVLIIIS